MSTDPDLFTYRPGRKECPFPVPFDICQLFEKLTLDLWRSGIRRYSARGVMHRIRWHRHVEAGDRSFKANNNWTPALARWFHEVHPDKADFFELRASPGEGGPTHDMEDYAGPYQGKHKAVVDHDDGQPDEQQEWRDYDPDC